jgi:acyl carrier protein
MACTRDDLLAQIIELATTVAEGASHLSEQAPMTGDTRISADLDWSSMEVVILANALQEHYGRTFPFIEWFQSLAREERQDLTLGEWADFIYGHLQQERTPREGVR